MNVQQLEDALLDHIERCGRCQLAWQMLPPYGAPCTQGVTIRRALERKLEGRELGQELEPKG